ncbi:hypothetical protein M408DRAFT_13274 [Serendipita vermifera MAFF 305830]|uniref:Uncharacterized protein n=1 Tax=Serendipita vermifera MAFF 305830 TaxID=933852 RepID=A0A0C3A5B1_SERVB|nr:hypothetical protein M408DRAFT_13274 [Serendipita vermifera MAFF 305830]
MWKAMLLFSYVAIPPHEIAPAVTVGETIATSLKGKNVTWSSIRLLTDSDDIQNVCFPDIQDRIKQLFSTELFILADSDPIAYKFRNDQDLQAHLPLRVAFLQCQRLVAAAPRHKIFGLPLIHLSRALLHLIISLAEEITREKLGDTTIASLISRMKSRVDDLKAIFVDVEDLAYPLLTAKKTLIGYFHKLCREQPGVVSVRYSFDSFNDFLSRSMELSRQANPGRPEEEHEASPANEVNEDDTSVSSDSLSTSESEASG